VGSKNTTHIQHSRGPSPRAVWGPGKSEGGAIAVMAAFVIILMIAMFGFALDLSRTYNRKMELQSVADAAALAAAGALDGTPNGLDNAVLAAATAAATFNLSYNNVTVTWSADALTFGTAPNGGSRGWVDGGSAKGSAGDVFFARVDTSKLDPDHGRVVNVLMPVLSRSLAETNVSAAAVAGRDSLNALPLAICANANTAASSLTSGELVEYGFRRGVSYDLMNLNPGDRSAENFLVNPIAPAGTVGGSMMGRMEIVAAYVCTGQMAIPTLQGGEVTVERGFPIASLYEHLNSRFGTYTTPCQPSSAPTDPNGTRFDLAGATWMKDKPDGQSANPLPGPDPLLTVAERPAGATGTSYGPLWAYAKAARYTSYTANKGVEPAAGYTTYGASDWNTLYSPGQPAAQSYPATTPYQNTGGAAAYKTPYNTRVLRVPLLQCPVNAGAKASATVLGIGKFFMTVPATSSAVYGEFAGMETWAAIRGNVRLY
jgi:Flp pilus assembly protein TadG